jgi:biopolymer transport protein ExbD
MQFTRRSRKRVGINITPLIDILFLLIIFFVVTSTFLEQSGMRLELPSAETAEPTEVQELVLNMDEAGLMRLDQLDVTIETLSAALREKLAAGSGRVLVIRADRDAPHGTVVEVMDIAKRSGVQDLVIATDAAPGDRR